MGYVGLLLLCSIAAVHLGPALAGWSSEICFPTVEPGPCRGYFPKWFYNSTSNRCEVFIYGGCQGNLNRFETRKNCENACGCDLCTLQPETGPCRARIPSYYYSTASGKCEQFTYGGCQGNENRFTTAAECAGNCSGNSSCPVRGQIYEQCRCSGTCNNPRGPCLVACPDYNCVCPPGKLIDTEANECVDPSQCPVNCSNVRCPSTNCVVGVNATIPPGSCCPVCACEVGGKVYYAGDEFKIDCNNCSCVLGWPVCHTNEICEESASASSNRTICPIEGQEYMECGTACPLTCKEQDPVPCSRQCVPGCQCPRGTVLDEENKRCVESHLCPVSPCDMCNLQPESGRCRAYFPNYFWNVTSRRCERFIYGGCGGNANRFPTLDMCQTKCACAGVNCNKGSRCKVHQPTGRTYCEPSCDNDNGGCPTEQICSLRNVTCIRAPCPPEVECECPIKNQVFSDCGTACPPTCSNPNPQICTLQCVRGCQCRNGRVLDEVQNKCVKSSRCSCPPTCSHEYCSSRSNRKKPCSRPNTNSTTFGCPNRCQSTHCDACYYSELPRNTPQRCDNKVCSGEEASSRCLRSWAKCISRQNRRNNQCTGDCIAAENFRCYDYPSDACASN